jgi:outer membrane lipoprotein SlyB
MAKRWITILVAVIVSSCLVFFASCESDAQTGALIGTAAGAGAGQAIGGNTEATLIGAGVGAAAGYIIGNEQDKKKAKAERQELREKIEAENKE